LGKVGGPLKFVGIGALAVLFLISAIKFGINCNDYSKFDHDADRHYSYKNPITYNPEIYSCGLATTIFGAIGFLVCLVAIFSDALFADQQMLGMIICAIPLLLGIGCTICDGLYYDYSVKEQTRDTFAIYRNNTAAQEYIKEAIGNFYEQGIANLREKFSATIIDGLFLTWKDVQDQFGKENIEKNHYFTIADLWNPNGYYTMVQGKFYLTFKVSNGGITDKNRNLVIINIPVPVPGLDDLSIPVASTKFYATPTVSATVRATACWNTTRSEYKCKTLKPSNGLAGLALGTTYGVTQFVTTNSERALLTSNHPFKLNQYIVDNYHSKNELDKDSKTAYYLIYDFPISYHMMTNKEEASILCGYCYTAPTKYFKINCADFANKPGRDYIYRAAKPKPSFCKREPKTYEEAFTATDNVCFGEWNVDQYNSGGFNSQFDSPLKDAFNYENIKSYPSWYLSYENSEWRERLRNYAKSDIAQFALVTCIASAVSVLFLIGGIALGFLAGSDK